MATAEIQRTL